LRRFLSEPSRTNGVFEFHAFGRDVLVR
jgi:hypothetical protein